MRCFIHNHYHYHHHHAHYKYHFHHNHFHYHDPYSPSYTLRKISNPQFHNFPGGGAYDKGPK